MKTLLRATLAIGLLLTPAPRSAWAADGTITGLSFTPATGAPNQDVTITVLGTQKCKKLNVNFGDQSPVVTLDNPDFENNNQADNSAVHAYASAGNYTVTATALEQCTGAAQKTLKVGGGGVGTGVIQPGLAENLCKILDNCPQFQISKAMGQTLMVFPKLEAIFPFSVPEPGGDILVFGKNFGNTPGELHLYLKTDQKDLKLVTQQWSNGGAAGRVRSSTVGVVDQPAEIYVKSANGFESNRMGGITFKAQRAIKVLPRVDVEIASANCPHNADCDTCEASNNWKFGGNCFSMGTSLGTLSGYHWQDCFQIGDDTGTDTYDLKSPLKNGWVLDSAQIHNSVAPSEGYASASVTSSQIKVSWNISPCDGNLYYVNVLIKGPIGTSY